MAKSKARKRGGGAWTGADHIVRRQTQLQKEDGNTQKKIARSERLSHGTKTKREKQKLDLHITKTKRELEKLKERVTKWDDVGEAEAARKRKIEAEKERKRQEEEEEAGGPKKRRKRPGPETWKLRGAARPAWEVYDFDTRYVDPYLKAHEEARDKAQRIRNLLVVYEGDLGNPKAPPVCREYLSLLMRLGLLYWQGKKMKSARQYFIDCMEADRKSHITTARCRLMRLYMEANRPDSARRLWEEKLSPDDSSVWIRYSAALIEFVSWKLLEEEGSTEEKAEGALVKATRANPFCAYYLAFHRQFEEGMEYTEDIEDAVDAEPLEEAIEYCNSEQMGAWMGTKGALTWVRHVIRKGLQRSKSSTKDDAVDDERLQPSDLEWRDRLDKLEAAYHEMERGARADDSESKQEEKEAGNEEEENESVDDDDSDDDSVDFIMYAGMFRTCMEMLEEDGAFNVVENGDDGLDEDYKTPAAAASNT